MSPSRRSVALVLVAVAVAAAAGGYWLYGRRDRIPDGFARSHGRIEAERIDVATKFAGRLLDTLVKEGDFVEPGQVVARLDSAEIEAQLREAEARTAQAEQALLEARAVLAQRKSELNFKKKELARAETLGERGYATGETVDLRRSELATAEAAVASAEAGIGRAAATIDAAQAGVDRLRSNLADYELTAPKGGRVQYRLVEPGEIVAVGGRVVTLLDLTNVYMTIFVPTSVAGRLRYGAEARLIFDAAPEYVVPGTVTFVASEAQFTPKYVEVESEREKLMFRVKVAVPVEVLEKYQKIVKAGVPGVAWVKVDPDAVWPAELAVRLPDVR